MPIIGRLTAIYRSRGIEIATGLNPSHFDDFPLAPFTWFLKDGESLTNGLGIALQEIYFLECLFARYRPAHLFAIGNAMGWSTLALGLLNPQGKVLAIDAGLDRNSLAGIDFTNAAALQEALPVTVLRGRSPEDVGQVIGEQAMLPIDFAFIDGHHSTEQVAFDFGALRPHAAANCVYLFHDVATFALAPTIERLAADNRLSSRLLPGTNSGMALVYDPRDCPLLLDDIAPFAAAPAVLQTIREAAWSHRHRHLARWRRSVVKRLGQSRAALPGQ